jgi:hypothetical protein
MGYACLASKAIERILENQKNITEIKKSMIYFELYGLTWSKKRVREKYVSNIREYSSLTLVFHNSACLVEW